MADTAEVQPGTALDRDAASPAARVDELRRLIVEANEAYYERDAPTMTDAEYDALFRELVALEQAYPDLQTDDSPTLRVGSAPSTQFAEVRHATPMLSLANAFGEEELRSFDVRVRRGLGLPAPPEPARELCDEMFDITEEPQSPAMDAPAA